MRTISLVIIAAALAACSDDSPATTDADTTDGVDTSVDAEADSTGDVAVDVSPDITDIEEDPVEPLPEMPASRAGWPGDFCSPYPDASVNNGRDTYDAQCASCHGADALGAELGPPVAFPAIDYAAWVTRNGRDLLAGYPVGMDVYVQDTLPDEELCEVLTYLQSFEKPATGEELYNVFCSTCHGFGGNGDGIANEGLLRFLNRPGEFFDINRSGHGGSNYGASRQYMPSRDTGELTDAEIQLIIDYLSGL